MTPRAHTGQVHPDVDQDAGQESDLLGIVAIALGCVGILVAGIVFCLVVGFLAAVAGGRAREQGRSLDNAYIAFLLAAVDGVAWIVLHVLFDMHFLFG